MREIFHNLCYWASEVFIRDIAEGVAEFITSRNAEMQYSTVYITVYAQIWYI